MATPEQDIAQFEDLLRKLEREFDLFFCGQRRGEPVELEKPLQAIIRAYGNRPMQNSTLNFRFNSLVARYNSLRMVWSRRLREREEGRAVGSCVARPVAPPRHEPRYPVHPSHTAANPAEYLTSDPMHESRRLETFFNTYRKLRTESGESTAKLRAESFQKALAEKVEKIKREQGCDAVLVRVVNDNGRTRIVAKPFRRPLAGSSGAAP